MQITVDFFHCASAKRSDKIISVFALQFKLVQCGYRYTVFTAHRLSPTNEAPLPMASPHYTHAPRSNLKDDLEKCPLTPQTAPGLAQLVCLLDSRWQSESLAAGILCHTDGISKCLSHCRSRDAGSPNVLNDVNPFRRKGT